MDMSKGRPATLNLLARQWPMRLPRVVVVEDNRGDADLAVEHLREQLGSTHAIDVVSTLRDAIGTLGEEGADAVILDLNLPDSRGLHTLQKVKAVADDVPVIVVSGLINEITRQAALSEGAQEVLAKDIASLPLMARNVMFMLDRARVRNQHRQLQRLLDTTPDAILVVNGDGILRYVNQAALALFGRTHEELLGEQLGFSVPDEESTEITIQAASGERHGEMRVVPMVWNGEPCSLATIRDVTERRQAEALLARSRELEAQNHRIEAASRLKSEFLANMSHELRTPLNAIIGFSELLHRDVVLPTSPKYKVFLHHIGSSGRHLLKLINDILDLAKVEAGKISFRPAQLQLRQVVGEVADVVGAMANERRVRIVQALDPALEEVFLDPERFKQVLYNYVSNGLKFTPEGGTVTIRAFALDGDRFRIEVEDTGEGIAPQDIDRLFIEFQQLDGGSNKRHKGTGLGLALTKRLVAAQGGHVGVQSTVGKGSVFFAVLPRLSILSEGDHGI